MIRWLDYLALGFDLNKPRASKASVISLRTIQPVVLSSLSASDSIMALILDGNLKVIMVSFFIRKHCIHLALQSNVIIVHFVHIKLLKWRRNRTIQLYCSCFCSIRQKKSYIFMVLKPLKFIVFTRM